jgi:hypothetical protein
MGEGDVDCVSNAKQQPEAGIAGAVLDTVDRLVVDADKVGQGPLREARVQARLPQTAADDRSASEHPCGRRVGWHLPTL